MKHSDEQLIDEYLDGNEKAIGTLVDKYLIDVYNFTFKLTRDHGASEDITQESFIKAWKNIRGWKRQSSFKTWLFVISRNTAISWLRSKRDLSMSSFENKEGRNILAETISDGKPSANELLVLAEDINLVQNLLQEINPLYRDVLTLRYEDKITFEEIGQILKRPLHTVKSQHRRAIVSLRRLLQVKSA